MIRTARQTEIPFLLDYFLLSVFLLCCRSKHVNVHNNTSKSLRNEKSFQENTVIEIESKHQLRANNKS